MWKNYTVLISFQIFVQDHKIPWKGNTDIFTWFLEQIEKFFFWRFAQVADVDGE